MVELLCTYDPDTRGGESPPPDAEGNVRKVKGTIHWVHVPDAVDVEVRLYEHLFATEDPEAAPEGPREGPPESAPGGVPEGGDWLSNLNPESLRVVRAKAEPAVADDRPGVPLQFERHAYFVRDPEDAVDDDGGPLPVFNRTVTLRDTWAKQRQK